MKKHILQVMIALFAASQLAGCGGGGGGTSSTGRLAIKVIWPPRTKLIPAASNSIKAILNAGSTSLGQQILVRPQQGPWTTTVTFDNLQPGSVTLAATAFPNPDGTGVAQATGSAPASIAAGQTTQVTVTMNSTIASITLAPTSPSITIGATAQLSVTAKDAGGNVVLISPSKLQFNSRSTAVATVSSTGLVTGVSTGTSNLTVADTESGVTSAIDLVTVTAPQANVFNAPIKTVVTQDGKFAYVLNGGGGAGFITQHRINADGTLSSPIGTNVAFIFTGSDIVMDRTGSFVYAQDTGNGTISGLPRLYQLKINADGTLSPLGAPVGGGGSTKLGLLVAQDNNFIYLGNTGANGSVVRLQIDPNGFIPSLTAGGIGLVGTNLIPGALATDPTGQFFYISGPNGTGQFKASGDIHSITGTYVRNGPLFATKMSVMIEDSTGKSLYGTALDGTTLFVFNINNDGTLAPGSPASVISGQALTGVAITPNNQFVYVSDGAPSGQGKIWQLRRNADGSLTPLSPASVPTQGSAPQQLTVDSAGAFLYAPDKVANSVQAFRINANGTLTSL